MRVKTSIYSKSVLENNPIFLSKDETLAPRQHLENVDLKTRVTNQKLLKDVNILFPEGFYDALNAATQQQSEIHSLILAAIGKDKYGKQVFIPQYIKSFGYGTSVSAPKIDDTFVSAMSSLVRDRTSQRLIDSHTHTVGTGEYWYDKPSSQDISAASKALDNNPDYVHLLITPTKIITLGSINIGFIIATVSQEVKNILAIRHNILNDQFNKKIIKK
jgi:hypothetical protein